MAATTIHLREVCRQTLVDFSAVPVYAGPFLRTPFKPCVQFSCTRLNDDLTDVAFAADFTGAPRRFHTLHTHPTPPTRPWDPSPVRPGRCPPRRTIQCVSRVYT